MDNNSIALSPSRMAGPSGRGQARKDLRALHHDVLEAIAAGRPLEDVGRLLCERAAILAPAAVCSILTVDDDRRLRPLAGPGLPDPFSRAIDGVAIGPDAGSCGAAAFHGRAMESRDIDSDPAWQPFRARLAGTGLCACWSSPIAGRDGRVVGTFAFYFRTARGPTRLERRVVDASVHLCSLAIEHERVWQRLSRANARFDMILGNMSQGVSFFDDDRRLIVANPRYLELYDLAPGSIGPGTAFEDILDLRRRAGSGPTMHDPDYLAWREALRLADAPTDTVVELENGRVMAISSRAIAESGWISTHEDITERRRAEAQVAYLAAHDALTGLANRALFRDRIEQALALSGRGVDCAVLFLDLDRFKAVNDSFGHAVGDALLRSVADRLSACVREVDTVTRLGGDEFAVLLVGVDAPDSTCDLAGRIIRTLGAPFDLLGHRLSVGVSIGIAVTPGDGSSPERLMKCADTALYRAKADAPGSFRLFEPGMDARLLARRTLEQDLRAAIAASSFDLAYQPLVDLAADAICGFEALLRWHHPVRGQVSPGEFIPVCEEMGVIVPLGAWVLRQACATAATWPGGAKIAVNLSAIQLRDPGIVAVVGEALAQSGLPASRLELEITESVLLTNDGHAIPALHRLRDLGVRISMDDFGIGYSSLSYLRSFPFDKIKIDQSFVRDLSDRADSIAIIRAVVGLGRSLGMKVTAEGVETAAQCAILKREGCDELQGYLFGRPMPAAQAMTLLAAGPPALHPAG